MSKLNFEYTNGGNDFPTFMRAEGEHGITVELHYEEYDQDLADPRHYDNPSTMYIYRPGYELGDEQLTQGGFDEIECESCDGTGHGIGPENKVSGFIIANECQRCGGWGRYEPTLTEFARNEGALAIMPLFIYEHSGMSISSGRFIWLGEGDEVSRSDIASHGRVLGDAAGWDTSFSGFLLATREGFDHVGCSTDRESVEQIMESEVEEYDKYLRGEVYGFVIRDADDDIMESCGMFLGDDHLKAEAENLYECCVDSVERELVERERAAACDIVTV